MGLEVSKCYSSYSFYPIWAKLYDKYESHREYKVMDILAICQKNKILWHFEILAYESMGNLKCRISQKRLIVERHGQKFGTQDNAYMQGTFDARVLEISLGSFHALCKISDVKIFKMALLPQFRSISTKLYCKYVRHKGIQAVTLFGYLLKFNILWDLKIFVNTETYGAGNLKTLLLLQFSPDLGQTL